MRSLRLIQILVVAILLLTACSQNVETRTPVELTLEQVKEQERVNALKKPAKMKKDSESNGTKTE